MNRFNRKRISQQSTSKVSSKTLAGHNNSSFNFKQSKKNLPEVCIDLDNKINIVNRDRGSSANTLKLNIYSNQAKYEMNKEQSGHRNTSARNQIQKSQIFNLTTIAMSQLREQVQQLRMENQSLIFQNRQLKATQEYLSKKVEKLQKQRNQNKRKLQKERLNGQQQIAKLNDKVSQLYERLIEQKKKNRELIQGVEENESVNFNSTFNNPRVTKFENTEFYARAGLNSKVGFSEPSPIVGVSNYNSVNSSQPFWLQMQKEGQAAFYASLRNDRGTKISTQDLERFYHLKNHQWNQENYPVQNHRQNGLIF